jgi:hypothetical protein
MKMKNRVAAIGCLFSRCFGEIGSVGRRSDLCVIVNVWMSLYFEMIVFEQVVRLWIVLSPRFIIVVSRQVNVAVVCYSLTCFSFYLHFVITLIKIIHLSINSLVPL